MITTIPATSENENVRLEALQALEILDTEREPEFDELVNLASAICEVPMSSVTLVDADRQWFKAKVGLKSGSGPREIAFCNHVIQQTGLFVVEDAQNDDRFTANPFVTSAPHIRFYAGMPVTSPDGHAVGTLCVIDTQPKTLTAGQITALEVLAGQVSVRMELRVQRKRLEQALQSAETSEAKLRDSENRFRAFMDFSPLVSFMKDEEGKYLFYSAKFAELFQITPTAWLGKSDFDLFPVDMAKQYRAHDLSVLEGDAAKIVEETTLNPDGTTSTWRSYKFPYIDRNGSRLLGGMSVEITEELKREEQLRRSQKELEEANARLAALVRTDALTGLHNRRGFDERLRAEFMRAQRADRTLSVLLIDVDNFKRRNDSFGHPEGDATLRQLAELLKRSFRVGDLVARYGGEEFVVLLPETTEQQAMQLADRALTNIREGVWSHEPVTVSIGAAAMHPAMRNEERIVVLADEALYAAKQSGKDRAISYAQYFRTVVAPASTMCETALLLA